MAGIAASVMMVVVVGFLAAFFFKRRTAMMLNFFRRMNDGSKEFLVVEPNIDIVVAPDRRIAEVDEGRGGRTKAKTLAMRKSILIVYSEKQA